MKLSQVIVSNLIMWGFIVAALLGPQFFMYVLAFWVIIACMGMSATVFFRFYIWKEGGQGLHAVPILHLCVGLATMVTAIKVLHLSGFMMLASVSSVVLFIFALSTILHNLMILDKPLDNQ